MTHRDLKLENILLSEDNQPIVTDFGFARYVGGTEDQRARSRTFCGSYAYVAPEILQGTHIMPSLRYTQLVTKKHELVVCTVHKSTSCTCWVFIYCSILALTGATQCIFFS